ncbi:protein FAM98A isoform X4 [Bemisia tabaci]|uniref:protein FAM98A isoform X4 n=1 Tax=Bemisia tabaci TaxID=7038 RepID=UPI003B28D531
METEVADVLTKVGWKELWTFLYPLSTEAGPQGKRYPGASDSLVTEVIKDGSKFVSYSRVVEWLSTELNQLGNLNEHVNAITSQDDSSAFLLEISCFLKQLGCQYKSLTEGHLNDRLQSPSDRILLLDYLATELLASRIIARNSSESTNFMVTLEESSTAKDLKTCLSALKVSVPVRLSPEKLFSEIQGKWSERIVGREDVIASVYYPVRQRLKADPNMELANVLSAGEELALFEKTSSMTVRMGTQSSVNKVVIGNVPDRGGRPNEQQAPPPEMPSWSQRTSDRGSRGHGGYSFLDRRGGDRGGNRRGSNQDRGGRDREGWRQELDKHRKKAKKSW